jgi:DNA-binding Lrp family transcriptional regulator
MSYQRLIPSITEYSKKFKRLDSLDFKIIRAILSPSTYNVRRLAETVEAPKQTVSYRIRRFDRGDIVRFRAVINEPKLGLKSYSVWASTQVGKEDDSGCALTSFPLWRYLAVVDGWKLGNYVRYVIPPDKEGDLKAFLNELSKRELISDYEMHATASPKYPLLNMDFYAGKHDVPMFDWKKWVAAFDSYIPEKTDEHENYERAEFDLIDLIILRCLELNARTTQRRIVAKIAQTLGEKNSKKYIPLVSRRIKNNLNPQRLISGYRAYLFPNQEQASLLFLFHFDFQNTISLRKFTEALKHLPYNTSYEKILDRNSLFLRLVVPAFEYAGMRKSIRELAEKGHIKNANMLLGDLAHGTWDNVEIYQMFKEGAWNFSYGAATEMLDRLLHKRQKTKA